MNNIGIIITIIGTILTVFNTISAIRWRRRNYNYRKQIDYYKNELEEANQKYIKNLNNKKELTEFKSSPDSCVKCYTMFLPFLLIKIDVFS
ncbi:hypothetical protein [Staphylococcus aureus]